MFEFIAQIKSRNETLYQFGWWCLIAAILFLVCSKFSSTQVYNVSAWYKPFKFALSTWAYAWTMAWFCHYLPDFNVRNFNWAVIILLGFEIVYIALQAYRGQLSHYNTSTPLYSFLFSMMALAATAVTIYTAYIGILFCTNAFPQLPSYYLWSIRLAIFLFVIFSFEGFVMGSKLSHTVGGPDGGPGIPVLNWSTRFGDPRVPHFIGMHALQVVPLLSFFVLKNTKATFALALLYGALAIFTLVLALKGRSIFPSPKAATEQQLNDQ
jgi:hypothetical protein